jgi:hypothetical protein
VLPKIHSVDDLEIVTDAMEAFGRAKGTINFVACIESAKALYNIGTIAAWRSVYGPEKGGKLIALLVIPLIPLLPVDATECSPSSVLLVWGRRLYGSLASRFRVLSLPGRS